MQGLTPSLQSMKRKCRVMEKKLRAELEFLEYQAHIHAFKDELGKYYWSKFLILENTYNAKYGIYKRRW